MSDKSASQHLFADVLARVLAICADLAGEAQWPAGIDFSRVVVDGPGFINLTLKPQVWAGELLTMLREGASYGKSAAGAGAKVNVEYVSANPTGPMHVGH